MCPVTIGALDAAIKKARFGYVSTEQWSKVLVVRQSLLGGGAQIRDPLKPGGRANVIKSGGVLAEQAVARWLEALVSWEVSARIPDSCKFHVKRIISWGGVPSWRTRGKLWDLK